MRRLLIALTAVAALLPASAAQAGWYRAEAVDGPAEIVSLGDVDVARDGSGGVVYLKREGGAAQVFLSRLDEGKWQAPERLSNGAPVTDAAVTATDGGRLAAVWAAGGQVLATVIPAAAQAQAPAPPVVLGGGDATGVAIDMGINEDGYAVWSAGGDVRAARLDGTAWTPLAAPLDVDPSRDAGRGASRPRVAVSAEGNAVATWGETDATGRTRVMERRLTRLALSTVPQDLTLDSFEGQPGGSADSPDIDIEDDGSFACAASLPRASVWADTASDARPWAGVAPNASAQKRATTNTIAWAGATPNARRRGLVRVAHPSMLTASLAQQSYSMAAPEFLSDPAASAARSIAVGDVSGDGRDDLVFLSVRWAPNPVDIRMEMYAAYQRGDGRLDAAVKIAEWDYEFAYQLLIADLDRNGVGDIITTAANSVMVLRSNADGTFTSSTIMAGDPHDLIVTDVDRDGYLDVLVDSGDMSATVVHGGSGGIDRTSTLPLPSSAVRTTGDVTSDGLDDLILATIFGRPLQELRIYPALASGGYAAPVILCPADRCQPDSVTRSRRSQRGRSRRPCVR